MGVRIYHNFYVGIHNVCVCVKELFIFIWLYVGYLFVQYVFFINDATFNICETRKGIGKNIYMMFIVYSLVIFILDLYRKLYLLLLSLSHHILRIERHICMYTTYNIDSVFVWDFVFAASDTENRKLNTFYLCLCHIEMYRLSSQVSAQWCMCINVARRLIYECM